MSDGRQIKTVLITGGAGYVGAVLVPKLLAEGYRVKVFDLYLYGDDVFDSNKPNGSLVEIKGDIRNTALLKKELAGVDAVIHLACISNDPSYELNPALGKSINYDAFAPLVKISKQNGVKRFIYASSSSVYGVKDVPNVTEDVALEPLTDYSKFKAMCEDVLLQEQTKDFVCLIVRPATVCGYSPRLRLDLTVNILTNHAVNNRVIKVFGGGQKRPNLHIQDMTDFYLQALQWTDEAIAGKIYNVGYENHTVNDIAQIVKSNVNIDDIKIVVEPTNDNRSYHISSQKIERELGFRPKHTIDEAVRDLKAAFDAGKIQDSMTDIRYYNIKTMQAVDLK
ncbi:MAG: SDR family oxidoreductase [Candidatus Omnitrophica bacterium]|nr:SDR family oxidoreductase [Candidatus Omnitrophota bacterium]